MCFTVISAMDEISLDKVLPAALPSMRQEAKGFLLLSLSLLSLTFQAPRSGSFKYRPGPKVFKLVVALCLGILLAWLSWWQYSEG